MILERSSIPGYNQTQEAVMALDHSLVGEPGEPHERSWTSTDALLYAVGVGAGLGDPLSELQFTTENSEGVTQQVLPTFAVLISQAATGRRLGNFDRAQLVHAEQSFELHRPLPVAGTVRTVSTVGAIYDKGSGALVMIQNEAVDAATGEPMVTTRSGAFIRGEGGFGGERASREPWRPADALRMSHRAHDAAAADASGTALFQTATQDGTVVIDRGGMRFRPA